MSPTQRPAMDRRQFLGACAAAVGGGVALAGCTSSGSSNGAQSDTGGQAEDAFIQDGVVIPHANLSLVPNDNPYMAPHVTGVAINNSDSELAYVAVQFSIYDSEGVKIGQAMANTNGLIAGGKWRFEALSLGDWSAQMVDTMTCEITAW